MKFVENGSFDVIIVGELFTEQREKGIIEM